MIPLILLLALAAETPAKHSFDSARADYAEALAAAAFTQAQFQRSLTDVQKQLQAALQQADSELKAKADALAKSCEGTVTGVEQGRPRCEAKAKPPESSKTDRR